MTFINSYVIYCENKLNAKEKPVNRKQFMKELHRALVNPYMERRLTKPTLHKKLKANIQDLVPDRSGESSSSSNEASGLKKRKICSYCPYKKHRMTKSMCSKCTKNICGEHKVEICVNCNKNE